MHLRAAPLPSLLRCWPARCSAPAGAHLDCTRSQNATVFLLPMPLPRAILSW